MARCEHPVIPSLALVVTLEGPHRRVVLPLMSLLPRVRVGICFRQLRSRHFGGKLSPEQEPPVLPYAERQAGEAAASGETCRHRFWCH